MYIIKLVINIKKLTYKEKKKDQGWKSGSVVKNTCCTIVRTRVQVPASTSGKSRPSVTQEPENLKFSSGLCGCCTHACMHPHSHMDIETHTHIKTEIENKNRSLIFFFFLNSHGNSSLTSCQPSNSSFTSGCFSFLCGMKIVKEPIS